MNRPIGFISVRKNLPALPILVRAQPARKTDVELLYSDWAVLVECGLEIFFTPDAREPARAAISASPGCRLIPFCQPPAFDALSVRHSEPFGIDRFIGACTISWFYGQLLKNRRPAVYGPDSNLRHCLKVAKRFKELQEHHLVGMARILSQYPRFTNANLLSLNTCLLDFLDKAKIIAELSPKTFAGFPVYDAQGHITVCE